MYENLGEKEKKGQRKEAKSWAWCMNPRTWETKMEDHRFKNSLVRE